MFQQYFELFPFVGASHDSEAVLPIYSPALMEGCEHDFCLQELQAKLEEEERKENEAQHALQAARQGLDSLQAGSSTMQASYEDALRQVRHLPTSNTAHALPLPWVSQHGC